MKTDPTDASRRRFLRTAGLLTGGIALGITASGSALADAGNSPALPGRVYASGSLFATRDVTDLPPPKGNNAHSYDEIFVFTNGADGQLPVAEAAPGERGYNGGRWTVTMLEWDIADPPLLTSDDAIHMYADDITVLAEGARYFECPLVKLKD